MPEERRVFEFDPTAKGGFTEVRRPAEVEEPTPQNPEPPAPEPPKLEDLPQPEPPKDETPTVEPTPPEPPVEPTNETPPAPEPPEVKDETDPPVVPEPPKEITDEGNDPEPVDVPEPEVTDNFYDAATSIMKERGELPDDFDITGMSEEEASQKIFETYHETLKKDTFTELYSQFQTELNSRGWNEETLNYAQMLQNGVPPESITRSVNYDTLSKADSEKMTDDEKVEYIATMYRDKGWDEKDVKRVLTSLEIDGEYDPVVQEAQSHFAERKTQVDEQNSHRVKQEQQYHEQLAQYKQVVVSEIFNKKQIGDEALTEEQLDQFEDALYKRTVPVQIQGQVYNLTPYEQFEQAWNNDFAMRMYLFKKFMFRESDNAQIKQDALKQAEAQQLKKWGRKVKKQEQSNTPPQSKPKEQLSAEDIAKSLSPKEGSKSYLVEGGNVKQL